MFILCHNKRRHAHRGEGRIRILLNYLAVEMDVARSRLTTAATASWGMERLGR